MYKQVVINSTCQELQLLVMLPSFDSPITSCCCSTSVTSTCNPTIIYHLCVTIRVLASYHILIGQFCEVTLVVLLNYHLVLVLCSVLDKWML